MELLTKELRAALPLLYTNEDMPLADRIAIVKYHIPGTSKICYATEGVSADEERCINTDKPQVDYLFFGHVVGWPPEAGYFFLSELKLFPFVRDESFEPARLGDLVPELNGWQGKLEKI